MINDPNISNFDDENGFENESNKSNFDSDVGFKNKQNDSNFDKDDNSSFSSWKSGRTFDEINADKPISQNFEIPEMTEDFQQKEPDFPSIEEIQNMAMDAINGESTLTEDEVRRIAEEAVPTELRGLDFDVAVGSGDMVLTLLGGGGNAVWAEGGGAIKVKGTRGRGKNIVCRGWARADSSVDWYSDEPTQITDDFTNPYDIDDPTTTGNEDTLKAWLPTWDYDRFV